MKDKVLFIMFICSCLFLLSFVSADSCNPPSGYSYCYQKTNNYEGVTSIARIYFSSPNAINPRYADGLIYLTESPFINVGFEGDNLYVVKNLDQSAFTQAINDCNAFGCPHQEIQSGKFNLLEGEEKIYPSFISYACTGDCGNENSEDFWSWSTIGGGWNQGTWLDNYRVVQCFDNSDCSNGQICDKSGDWRAWNCKIDTQQTCEDKCDGIFYQSGGIYSNGACNYASRQIVKGKCGIQCLVDADCSNGQTCSSQGLCEGNIEPPKTNYLAIGAGVIIALILVFVVILSLKRKNKRR